jgi:phage-related protein
MPSPYTIAFFESQARDCPVEDYMFDGRNETDFEIIIAVIQRLAHVGQKLLDTNMAKRIDGPICELRKDRHRIMYAESKPRKGFILLSAFTKKTQKTPPEEIEKANHCWTEFLKFGKAREFDIPLDYDLTNL